MHPVRLRIVLAIQGRRLTAADLDRLLPDVPMPTLYRHLSRLTREGILRVEETHRVHSNQERVYALVEGAANLTEGDVAEASAEERLQYFTIFVTGLLSTYQSYLRSAKGPVSDRLMYYAESVELTDGQYEQICDAMRQLISDALGRKPEPGARRRSLAALAFSEADLSP